jgi:hypothetical protein
MRSSLLKERSTWEPHWRDVDQWLLPDRVQFNKTDSNQGQIKNTSIIDSTPTMAVGSLGAGLMSGITSPARPWFRLAPSLAALAEDLEVRQWLDECQQIMMDHFRSSNLYQALPNCYENLGAFGVDAVFFDEEQDAEQGEAFRFYNLPLGSYSLSANARGVIDCIVRDLTMTVRQTVEQFGERAVCPATKAAHDNGQYENPVNIVHAVIPSPDYVKGSPLAVAMRYISVFYEEASDGDAILARTGYRQFPVLCPRWKVTGRNVYGFGPGRTIIGDCKALQSYERKTAEAVAKEVNPPLLMPSSLRGKEVSLIPGGITYYDETDTKPGARSLYESRFNIDGAEMKANGCRGRIQRAMFEDLFLMLANSDRRQVTAEEIRAKQEEKILALGPVLERLNDELLDPLIDRAFDILSRRGAFPPPPEVIAGQPINVEYISILGQAQKMLQLGTVDRLLQVVGNMAAANSTILDKVDMEETIEFYSDALGAPSKLLKTKEQFAAIQQARAQAAAKQQMQADAANQAQVANTLSQTPTGGDTALSALIQQQTGAVA